MSGISKGTIGQRFESSVERIPFSGCWIWTGTCDTKGYGVIKIYPRKMRKAHRIAWELHKGPIPRGHGYHGTCVLHQCDNPPCVNPEHLFLGTVIDNGKDRDAKGRTRNQWTGPL